MIPRMRTCVGSPNDFYHLLGLGSAQKRPSREIPQLWLVVPLLLNPNQPDYIPYYTIMVVSMFFSIIPI